MKMRNRIIKYNGTTYVVGEAKTYIGHSCNKSCMLGTTCKFHTKNECPLKPYEVFLYRKIK